MNVFAVRVGEGVVRKWRTALVVGVIAVVVLPAPPVRAGDGGTIIAWGNGTSGMLGEGGIGGADSNVPVAVDRSGPTWLRPVIAVDAGQLHACAVAGRKAYCWGLNGYGALGNGSTEGSSAVPVAVDTAGVLRGKRVTAISAGFFHTCVVAGAKAYCWGRGSEGQLGNGRTKSSAVPVAVKAEGVLRGKAVTSISAGESHTCAVADGRAYCWGKGAIGASGKSRSKVPVAVSIKAALHGKKVTAISAGLEDDSDEAEWDGRNNTCAVAGGRAYCWGNNADGQLGTGTTVDSATPRAVKTSGALRGMTITAVSSGEQVTCAIAGGRVYCWGRSGGVTGRAQDSKVPVAVKSKALGRARVTALSTGRYHACAIAGGRAYCWGNNLSGELGSGSTKKQSEAPVAVDMSGFKAYRKMLAISTGMYTTVALYSRTAK